MEYLRLNNRQWMISSGAMLFVTGFLLYGRTLMYEFVELDDPLLILENAAVQSFSWAHLKTMFTTFDPELYIPLTLLSYQFDILIGGLHPFLIHFHNLLHHILNAGLLGLLCLMLLKNRMAALFAALLFLVHPIQSEAVIWATGRKDLLSTTFFLLSLLLYLRFLRKPTGGLYAGSLLTFLLGLLSKVTVISLPVILFLLDWLEGRRVTLKSLTEKIPYVALAIVFGIIAMYGKSDAPDMNVLARAFITAHSFTFSIGKIFVPMNLSPMYAYTGPEASAAFVLSLAIVLMVITAGFLMRKKWKLISFALGFILFTYLPSFWNLVKNGDYYLTSDRYSYIPLMGLCLIAAFLYGQAEKRTTGVARRILDGIVILLLLFFGFLTAAQSTVWSDSETLSRYVTQVSPSARLGHLWYGNALREAGKIEEALAEYNTALAFKEDAQVYYDRALAYEATGDIDAAIADYEKALTLSPRYALAHINLGRLEYGRGKKDAAQTHFVAAAEASPHLAMPLYNLGVLAGEQKDFEAAAEFYRQALERDPDLHDARANLSIALLALGKTEEAVDQLKETLRRDPENPTAKALMQRLIDDGVLTIKK